MLRGEDGTSPKATFGSDVYAFGVILWEVRCCDWSPSLRGNAAVALTSVVPMRTLVRSSRLALPPRFFHEQLMTWTVPWGRANPHYVVHVKSNGGHLEIPSTPESLAQLPGSDTDKAAFQRLAPRYTRLIKQVRCKGGCEACKLQCSGRKCPFQS